MVLRAQECLEMHTVDSAILESVVELDEVWSLEPLHTFYADSPSVQYHWNRNVFRCRIGATNGRWRGATDDSDTHPKAD